MRRYAIRPSSFSWAEDPDIDYDAVPMPATIVVYEPDDTPRPTGLIDHHGHELVSVPVRDPIGFVRFVESE